MNSLTWLVVSILEDSGIQCSTDVSRDVQRVQYEAEHRGESFLTLTLPAFGDAFDECLSRGQIDLMVFPAILRKRYRKGGKPKGIPAFLRGVLSQVFSLETGIILNEPNETAIFAVRQSCRATKKLRTACSPKRMRKAIERFKECDAEIAHSNYVTNWDGRIDFIDTAKVLWSETLTGFTPLGDKSYVGIIPKHGPGATAERISGNQKFHSMQWTERLQAEFPADAFVYASFGHIMDEGIGDTSQLELLSPKDELPVRVKFVPKTAKGPRVIAIEPVCMQYAQQAVMEWLVKKLEATSPMKGHLNFSDQTINQSLAMRASVDQKSATIDLSEASDRVSAIMVSDMLQAHPQLRRAVFACRTSRAKLPDGEIIHLRKFASMGSALCFPIEAMVFYTMIASVLLRKHNLRLTLRNIEYVMRGVYIYGDDIIVPIDEVATVIDTLNSSGLKVNTTKSFWNGQFRESCGTDAFNGISVKPVYARELLPGNRRSHEEIISAVSLANQFYMNGYWQTAQFIRDWIEQLVGEVPHLGDTSPGIGWYSFLGYLTVQRWNDVLHRFEVKAMKVTAARKKDPLDGYHALLKFFLKRGIHPFEDERHLRETVRSGTVSIKRRWLTAC